jgi:hypothetical protein
MRRKAKVWCNGLAVHETRQPSKEFFPGRHAQEKGGVEGQGPGMKKEDEDEVMRR